MNLIYIGIIVYIILGLVGYSSIGGVGARPGGERKPSLWRKALVVLLWPLAMIGAIEG